MKYILDTNICIYLIKKKPVSVLNRLSKIKIKEVGISSITLSELEYGAAKSSNPDKNRVALIEFASFLEIYNYDAQAAREYGIIRADLERSGKIIGAMDMLIAAQAKGLNLILVTNNEKEFNRIPGLKIENWVN
ncbi:MAG: twitching motility protein PilT [Deltaproteobacteria bacterium RBG_19FT_COMBO_43_11]|nr:MAG: twitching motility protein PilT [Deltaproteobacteria bacterium RBG_16_44_11]OGP91507.1 MAG: twitching motility protein PilT [Deltaproteobacteria bacterium RBG_19FT_COMBO_43_11]